MSEHWQDICLWKEFISLSCLISVLEYHPFFSFLTSVSTNWRWADCIHSVSPKLKLFMFYLLKLRWAVGYLPYSKPGMLPSISVLGILLSLLLVCNYCTSIGSYVKYPNTNAFYFVLMELYNWVASFQPTMPFFFLSPFFFLVSILLYCLELS